MSQESTRATLQGAMKTCELCPRRCKANRVQGKTGVCAVTSEVRVARAALHFWEEPPISGEAGSGAIFFSGCPLRCVFCQNHEISRGQTGEVVSVRRLAKIMLELEEQGALNVNLVTPLHYAPQVREAILMAREAGLAVPVVCNTSGYELTQTVQAMCDVVDVWLPDFKYASGKLAAELSHAADYPERATEALTVMRDAVRAAGGRKLGADGRMERGIIVRHLVLPSHSDDSCDVLDRVWDIVGNEADLSVMNQYTPNEQCRAAGGPLSEPLSESEYELVLDHADELGFERMWWQQGGTVSESFVPSFDKTGVTGPEL